MNVNLRRGKERGQFWMLRYMQNFA